MRRQLRRVAVGRARRSSCSRAAALASASAASAAFAPARAASAAPARAAAICGVDRRALVDAAARLGDPAGGAALRASAARASCALGLRHRGPRGVVARPARCRAAPGGPRPPCAASRRARGRSPPCGRRRRARGGAARAAASCASALATAAAEPVSAARALASPPFDVASTICDLRVGGGGLRLRACASSASACCTRARKSAASSSTSTSPRFTGWLSCTVTLATSAAHARRRRRRCRPRPARRRCSRGPRSGRGSRRRRSDTARRDAAQDQERRAFAARVGARRAPASERRPGPRRPATSLRGSARAMSIFGRFPWSSQWRSAVLAAVVPGGLRSRRASGMHEEEREPGRQEHALERQHRAPAGRAVPSRMRSAASARRRRRRGRAPSSAACIAPQPRGDRGAAGDDVGGERPRGPATHVARQQRRERRQPERAADLPQQRVEPGRRRPAGSAGCWPARPS